MPSPFLSPRVAFSSRAYKPLKLDEPSGSENIFVDLSQISKDLFPAADSEAKSVNANFTKAINIQTFVKGSVNTLLLIATVQHPWVALIKPTFGSLINDVCSYVSNKVERTSIGSFIDTGMKKLTQMTQEVRAKFGLTNTSTNHIRFSSHSNLPSDSSSEQYIDSISNAIQKFFQSIKFSDSDITKSRNALTLVKSIASDFEGMSLDTAQPVSREVKEVHRIVNLAQKFFSDIPTQCERYNQLTEAKRYELFNFVVNVMASSVPELSEWGHSIAKELGYSQATIQSIKDQIAIATRK